MNQTLHALMSACREDPVAKPTTQTYNNNDRLTAFDPGQPG